MKIAVLIAIAAAMAVAVTATSPRATTRKATTTTRRSGATTRTRSPSPGSPGSPKGSTTTTLGSGVTTTTKTTTRVAGVTHSPGSPSNTATAGTGTTTKRGATTRTYTHSPNSPRNNITTTTTTGTTTSGATSQTLLVRAGSAGTIFYQAALTSPATLPNGVPVGLAVTFCASGVPANGLVWFLVYYSCALNATSVYKSTDSSGTTWTLFSPAADGTGFVNLGAVSGGPDAAHGCAFNVTIKDNGRGDTNAFPSVVCDPLQLAAANVTPAVVTPSFAFTTPGITTYFSSVGTTSDPDILGGFISFCASAPSGGFVSFNLYYNCGSGVKAVYKSYDGGVSWGVFSPQADGTGAVDLGVVANPPDALHRCAFNVTIQDNGRGDLNPSPKIVCDPVATGVAGSAGTTTRTAAAAKTVKAKKTKKTKATP